MSDMEPGRRVIHRHGMHGPHEHGAADYAEHQRPMDEEEILSPGPALPDPLAAIERRVRRLEFIVLRLATHQPDALPADAHAEVAELARAIVAENRHG